MVITYKQRIPAFDAHERGLAEVPFKVLETPINTKGVLSRKKEIANV